jgi:hypothetical protein
MKDIDEQRLDIGVNKGSQEAHMYEVCHSWTKPYLPD